MKLSRQTIKAMDFIIEMSEPDCYENMSLSDKYFIASYIMKDDGTLDWSNQLVDDPINSLIEHALRCQSQEANKTLAEELKDRIVKYYSKTMRQLLDERLHEAELIRREPRCDY